MAKVALLAYLDSDKRRVGRIVGGAVDQRAAVEDDARKLPLSIWHVSERALVEARRA